MAHHTDCTFIRVSGAELVQKYIGEGSRMVREIFVMAREAAPTIIFMDEIDSIGSSRGGGGSSKGDSEVQRTMLELLNQLDGFEPSSKIKVGLNPSARVPVCLNICLSASAGIHIHIHIHIHIYIYILPLKRPRCP